MILAINELASDVLWEVTRAIIMLGLIVLAIFIGYKLRTIVDKKKAAKAELVADSVEAIEENKEQNIQ